VYVLIFTLLFLGGLLFASMSLQLTSDMGFKDALTKVVRRIFRSIAFRQLVVITACILLVRFALNNVLRFLARWSSSPVQWDKSKLYYVMKEVRAALLLRHHTSLCWAWFCLAAGLVWCSRGAWLGQVGFKKICNRGFSVTWFGQQQSLHTFLCRRCQ
jgi:hypothetical protein